MPSFRHEALAPYRPREVASWPPYTGCLPEGLSAGMGRPSSCDATRPAPGSRAFGAENTRLA